MLSKLKYDSRLFFKKASFHYMAVMDFYDIITKNQTLFNHYAIDCHDRKYPRNFYRNDKLSLNTSGN